MGYGGGRTNGAFYAGSDGLPQSDNQVFDELGKISSTLLVSQRNVTEVFVLFYPRQPVINDAAGTTLQNRGHSFFFHSGGRLASEQLMVNQVGELPSLEWFHDDFVRL